MKKLLTLIICILSIPAFSALPVVPVPADNQAALLESDSPELAANKRLAYDLWRTIIVARHIDRAEEFLTQDYIQHNPNADTGIEGFKAYFRASGVEPQPIKETIDDLVAIIAEGDLVVMAFAQERDNPKVPGGTYTTTWFDMFRIEDGLIAEHWDPATIAAP